MRADVRLIRDGAGHRFLAVAADGLGKFKGRPLFHTGREQLGRDVTIERRSDVPGPVRAALVPQRFARRERLDGRLAPPGPDDEDTVTFSLTSRARGVVRWRLELVRTSPEVARAQGLDLDALRAPIADGVATIRTLTPRSLR